MDVVKQMTDKKTCDMLPFDWSSVRPDASIFVFGKACNISQHLAKYQNTKQLVICDSPDIHTRYKDIPAACRCKFDEDHRSRVAGSRGNCAANDETI